MNKDQFGEFIDTQTSSKSSNRPFSEILQEIVNHVTEIVRSEIQLARVEVRKDVAQITKASAFLIIGAVFTFYALGFLLLGVMYAISTTVAPWLAAVIIGLGAGLAAAIFLLVSRRKIKQADLRPVNTIRSVRENVTWMKKRVR